MPIRNTTLKKYSERYFGVFDGMQTLEDALKWLKEKRFHENNTYIIVSAPEQNYQVSLFLNLRYVVINMGKEAFTTPLNKMPIPLASRVVSIDTNESDKKIVDWVAKNPQSTVVVVDGSIVVGLFTNPYRSGDSDFSSSLTLSKLYGDFVQLHRDKRADFVPSPSIMAPICEYCGHQDYYDFDPNQGVYKCRKCKKVKVLL